MSKYKKYRYCSNFKNRQFDKCCCRTVDCCTTPPSVSWEQLFPKSNNTTNTGNSTNNNNQSDTTNSKTNDKNLSNTEYDCKIPVDDPQCPADQLKPPTPGLLGLTYCQAKYCTAKDTTNTNQCEIPVNDPQCPADQLKPPTPGLMGLTYCQAKYCSGTNTQNNDNTIDSSCNPPTDDPTCPREFFMNTQPKDGIFMTNIDIMPNGPAKDSAIAQFNMTVDHCKNKYCNPNKTPDPTSNLPKCTWPPQWIGGSIPTNDTQCPAEYFRPYTQAASVTCYELPEFVAWWQKIELMQPGPAQDKEKADYFAAADAYAKQAGVCYDKYKLPCV